MRVFFRWAAFTGHTGRDPAERLPSVKAAPAVPRPASEKVYRRALDGAEPRVRQMLRLSAELGLRRAELAQLHRRDLIDTDSGAALLVNGKGGRKRLIPVPLSLARDIALADGFLFPRSIGGHLSPQWIGKLIGQQLGGATMHQLRHTFATRAYSRCHDLLAMQQLLGHTSVAATQRYIAVDAASLRQVVDAAAGVGRPTVGVPGGVV